MQKPVDLIIEDVKMEVYGAMNNSGLPITILEMIIKEVKDNVTNQKVEYVTNLRKQYEEALNAEVINQQNNINENIEFGVVNNPIIEEVNYQ